MAKLNLQEMYLTEYNRLIVALQKHFTELKGKTKISEITDWLNARQAMTPITEIDLNKITFTGDEYQYSYGGQTIKLKKDNDLTGSNIVVGKVIEGITGTAVDGSVLKVTENEVEGFLGRVGSDIDYWYYDTVNKKLSSKKGTATLIDNRLLSDLEYNEDNEVFGFKSDDENNSNYYKNFRVAVPKANITTAADGNGWTISVGYLPESQTIQKLTNAEKEALETNLKFGSEVLGVTGSNEYIINTEVLGSEESANHIIDGQTYFRNGKPVAGNLQSLTSNNMFTYQDDDVDDTFDISGLIDNSKQTYFTIPANTYSHDELKFNISGIKAGNIKKGINIFGIDGEAEIYDRYAGDYNIILNTEAFTSLPTKEKAVLEDFTFELGSAFNKNNIRMGKTLLGVNGEFTQQDGLLPYVSYDSTAPLLEGTYEDGSTYQYRESSHIAEGHYAFIDGELIKGTNAAFVDAYTGPTNIVLNDVMPDALKTANKVVANDITFTPGAVLIPENIKVGTTILGIQGSFTEYSGSTPITPESIPMNYVGYINGEQIVGEAPTYDSINLPATLSGYDLKNGFYKDVQIEPLKLNAFGNIFIANTSAGKQWIASYLRKGTSLFVGGSPEQGIEAESIEGTGKTILIAQDHKSASLILKNAEENEIMHYTATGSALYPQNSYWEVVTDTIVGVPNPSNIPTFDRLFRARELNGANALESDVLNGRTYYDNKGVLKTGTIPVYDRYKYSFKADNSFPEQIEGAGYYAGITVGVDTTSINPAYIKKGATLFGVTGTYEPNLTSKTVYANKTYYAADDGYEGYSEFTVDVPEPLLDTLTIENQANESIASYYNKTYKPESPYVGYNEVIVKLQPKLYNGNATANGEVPLPDGYDGFSSVTVDVAPKLDSNRKVRWSDILSKTDIAPTGGASGFDKIRFDESIKLGTYTVKYEDLFKEEILPTGGTNAWTKIEIATDCLPGSLTISASDIENNKIITSAGSLYNEVKIGDVLDVNNEVTLTTVPQTFKSDKGKLFKSLTVNADMQDLVINTSDIDSGTTYIAGKTPGQLGWKSVKTSFSKESRKVTYAEMRVGEALSAPTDVLWSNITFDGPIKDEYKSATATAADIAYGKTAVLKDGDLVTGTMKPIVIEDKRLSGDFYYIWNSTEEVKMSTGGIVDERNLQAVPFEAYFNVTSGNNFTQLVNLSNTYWYSYDRVHQGELAEYWNPGLMSHASYNPLAILFSPVKYNLTREYEWKWKTNTRYFSHTYNGTVDDIDISNTILKIPSFYDENQQPLQYNSASSWKVRNNRVYIVFVLSSGPREHLFYDGAIKSTFVYNGVTYYLDWEWEIKPTVYSSKVANLIDAISWNSWQYAIPLKEEVWENTGNGPYPVIATYSCKNYNDTGTGWIKYMDNSAYQEFSLLSSTSHTISGESAGEYMWNFTINKDNISIMIGLTENYYKEKLASGLGVPLCRWLIHTT